MTQTDFWKNYPNMDKFSRNRSSLFPDNVQKLNRYSQKIDGWLFQKLIQLIVWASYPRNWNWNFEKILDEFSRNPPMAQENWNFGKFSGWVFQYLPIRDKSARSRPQFENQNKLRGCKQRQRVMKKVDPKCVSNGWLKAIKGTIVNWPPWWVAPESLFSRF